MSAIDKQAKIAVGAILLLARRTRVLLLSAIGAGAALAAADMSERTPSASAAILGAAAGASAMRPSLEAAIVQARERARAQSVDRLAAEIRSAGVDARGLDVPHMTAADHARAASAAASLASQWQARATAAAALAMRQGKSVERATTQTVRAMAPAAVRTAATETSNAWHHARTDAAAAYQKRYVAVLGRRWDARFDACDACWPYNGDVAGWNESFEDGAEPGDMHPHCRCVWTAVPLADEGREVA